MANDISNTDDLEALFDSIAGSIPVASPEPVVQAQPEPQAPASVGGASGQIGDLARTLHDTIAVIGNDQLRQAEQTAGKIRSTIGSAKTASDSIESGASQLGAKWQQLMDGKLSVEEFKALAAETRSFLQDAPAKAKSLSSQLSEAATLSDSLPVKQLASLAQQADQIKTALGA